MPFAPRRQSRAPTRHWGDLHTALPFAFSALRHLRSHLVLAAALLHMRHHGRQRYIYRRRAARTRDQERDARYLVMVDREHDERSCTLVLRPACGVLQHTLQHVQPRGLWIPCAQQLLLHDLHGLSTSKISHDRRRSVTATVSRGRVAGPRLCEGSYVWGERTDMPSHSVNSVSSSSTRTSNRAPASSSGLAHDGCVSRQQ